MHLTLDYSHFPSTAAPRPRATFKAMKLRSRVAVAAVLLLARALQVNANACAITAATNLVDNADYSSCVDGEVSGDTCTPTCSVGYATTTAATGFTMTCDANNDGSFDGADATLSCAGEQTAALQDLRRRRRTMLCPIPLRPSLAHSHTPHARPLRTSLHDSNRLRSPRGGLYGDWQWYEAPVHDARVGLLERWRRSCLR